MPNKKPLQETPLSNQIKQLIAAIEASGHAFLPHANDDLLKSIVEAAGKIFNAAAASILLVNEQEQVLIFKVAYGASNQDLVGVKFPMDKGIAGYVAMTGQPLSISNARQDPRFNQDFAKSTGYVPSSILATPLLAGDQVIGVMEVLDKINSASFGMQDMDLLAIFAKQAAIAINQSLTIDMLHTALVEGLKRLAQSDQSIKKDKLLKVLDQADDEQPNVNLLKIADLFNEISSLGDAEQKACIQILKVFADYNHSHHRVW
jgi:GAF domain-containing protein